MLKPGSLADHEDGNGCNVACAPYAPVLNNLGSDGGERNGQDRIGVKRTGVKLGLRNVRLCHPKPAGVCRQTQAAWTLVSPSSKHALKNYKQVAERDMIPDRNTDTMAYSTRFKPGLSRSCEGRLVSHQVVATAGAPHMPCRILAEVTLRTTITSTTSTLLMSHLCAVERYALSPNGFYHQSFAYNSRTIARAYRQLPVRTATGV